MHLYVAFLGALENAHPPTMVDQPTQTKSNIWTRLWPFSRKRKRAHKDASRSSPNAAVAAAGEEEPESTPAPKRLKYTPRYTTRDALLAMPPPMPEVQPIQIPQRSRSTRSVKSAYSYQGGGSAPPEIGHHSRKGSVCGACGGGRGFSLADLDGGEKRDKADDVVRWSMACNADPVDGKPKLGFAGGWDEEVPDVPRVPSCYYAEGADVWQEGRKGSIETVRKVRSMKSVRSQGRPDSDVLNELSAGVSGMKLSDGGTEDDAVAGSAYRTPSAVGDIVHRLRHAKSMPATDSNASSTSQQRQHTASKNFSRPKPRSQAQRQLRHSRNMGKAKLDALPSQKPVPLELKRLSFDPELYGPPPTSPPDSPLPPLPDSPSLGSSRPIAYPVPDSPSLESSQRIASPVPFSISPSPRNSRQVASPVRESQIEMEKKTERMDSGTISPGPLSTRGNLVGPVSPESTSENPAAEMISAHDSQSHSRETSATISVTGSSYGMQRGKCGSPLGTEETIPEEVVCEVQVKDGMKEVAVHPGEGEAIKEAAEAEVDEAGRVSVSVAGTNVEVSDLDEVPGGWL